MERPDGMLHFRPRPISRPVAALMTAWQRLRLTTAARLDMTVPTCRHT